MKRAELVWTSDSETDLRILYASLEEGQEGAGDHFVMVLDSTLELLRSFPEMAPTYEAPFRRLLIGKRNIGLFYAVHGTRIVIHALVFLQQDTPQIRNRLGLQS